MIDSSGFGWAFYLNLLYIAKKNPYTFFYGVDVDGLRLRFERGGRAEE
jgi:hypothetical protein